MNSYPKVRKALEMFSIQLGLDLESAREMLRRSLENPIWKEQLERELLSLVEDAKAPWIELLINQAYEVEEPDTQEDAKEIVLEILWEEVFSEPPPLAGRAG